MNPSFKTISIFLSSLIVGFFTSYRLNFFVTGIGIIFLLTSKRVKFKSILLALVPVLLLSLSFFMAGYKFSASGLTASINNNIHANFENGLVLGSRILAYALLGISYSMTTDSKELIYSFTQQLNLSNNLAYGILSAINMIPNLKNDLENIKLSYDIRSMSYGFLNIRPVFTLLVRSVRFSDNIASSMEAKGFGEDRTNYKIMYVKKTDYIVAVALPLIILTLGILGLWEKLTLTTNSSDSKIYQ